MANLGPTICRDFYFPYAWKMWGRDPDSLSGIQARRRVSAGSFLKLIRKVLGALPGLKPPGAGRFFYPRQGFGQISEAYAEAARKAGAELRLGTSMTGLEPPAGPDQPWRVTVTGEDGVETIEADYVWSTIPITILARAMGDRVPAGVQAAAREISYRSMILVYLVLDQNQFTPFDAHYFPGRDITITRLSEPKNYAARQEPAGRTVLCAELPCSRDDDVWTMDDAALGARVTEDLARAGIPLPRPPVAVHTRRLPQAYPIYQQGYEVPFRTLDTWVESLPRLLSYGRQGLFAHDNTHHALYMAYAAVECMTNGSFDQDRWARYREEFTRHVVED
jgi:protoporphyrinogen oxidase